VAHDPGYRPPARRRIYLMRHGAVEYLAPDGRRYGSGERPLSQAGRAQARAAGRCLADAGVKPDRVIASTLPRTIQTAGEVLGVLDLALPVEQWADLQELKSGRIGDIPEADLEREYARAFVGVVPPSRKYLGGETFGSMVDRVHAAVARIVAEPGWDVLLLVLHGAVNRAILSTALTGDKTYLGNFQQSPACINVLDVSAAAGEPDWVLRAVNIAPTDPAHVRTRTTTMEDQYLKFLQLRIDG
jgi:probable phosphoglycerate mutase